MIGFLEPIGVDTAFEAASLIRGSIMRDFFSTSTTVLDMLLLFSFLPREAIISFLLFLLLLTEDALE